MSNTRRNEQYKRSSQAPWLLTMSNIKMSSQHYPSISFSGDDQQFHKTKIIK
jgi:hypothetical protein